MVDKQIKILYILPLGGIGGAEKFVLSLCEHHNRSIFDISVCILFSGMSVANEIKRNGINLFRLNMRNGFDLVRAFKLLSIIKKEKFDVINIHGQNPLGKLVSILSSCPAIIHTDHGTTIGSPVKRKKRVVLFNRLMTPYIDRFIAISKGMKNSLIRREKVPEEKITLIYNGVDIDAISEKRCDTSKKLASININQNNQPILGTIGRLVTEKQYSTLFQSLAYLKKIHDRFITIIIGDGPLREQLEQQVLELDLKENIIFLGERDDVYDLLEVIDIFVFSSGGEAFSITLLEAMCKSKPIIAYDVEGVNEAVINGVNGYLVPFGEKEEFANRIEALLENSELLERMGKDGYEMAKNKFNIKSNINNLEKLLKKLVYTDN